MERDDSLLFLDVVKDVAEKMLNEKLKNKNVCQIRPAIVSSYNSITKRVRIAFPENSDTPSYYEYPNKTGRDLLAGDKVYLFHIYNDVSQGWVDDNTPLVATGGGTTIQIEWDL